MADLPDARIEQDFAELQRAAELIDAERLRRLVEIDRPHPGATLTTWLTGRTVAAPRSGI